MQELPQAAGGAPFLEARRWWALVTALIAIASSSAAFAQLNTPPLFTSIPQTNATEEVPYSYSITTTDLNVGDTRTLTAPTKPAWLTFTPGANGSGTLAGTPAQAQVGNHNVVLSVSDGTVSVTQSFTIVVANVDDQPVFTSTPVTAATEDVPYNYAIRATDDDGDALTITAQTKPAWLTFTTGANGIATLSGTPTQAQVGNHSVSLRVSDGSGAQVQQNFTIVVANVNDPPAFTSTPVTAATEDASYSYSITTSDPENDSRTVTAPTKPAWLTFTTGGNGSATLSGTPTQAQVGNHNVVLSVSDGTVSVTQSFTVVVANVDDQPVFTSTPVTTAATGAVYTYAITTTDADGDALTVTAATKPAWLTFTAGPNGTATLSGAPAQANVGANSVQLRVSDGTGALVQQNFTITVTHVNNAPSFTSVAPTSATQGAPYSYSITTSDPDSADSRTVTAPTKPAWLTFTAGANGTGTLSGTPAQAQVGSHNIVLSVSDGTTSVTQSFTILVANVDDQPVFTSAPVTAAAEGTAYNYAITTTDADNDPLTLTAPTKPAWLTFTPGSGGSGSLRGTPTQAEVGTHSVVLSVSDGTAPPVTQSFQIVVANTDDQPVFTSTPVTAASQGTVYTYAITATDADADTLTFAAPTKPAWLTLTPGASGTATLSGTPAQAQVGNQNVVLSVSDGTGPAVTQSFTIVVANVDDQPVFTSSAVTTASEGIQYVYAVAVSDADNDALTLTAPTKPAWLTFSAGANGTAVLSGTPAQAQVGTHNVVLSASDGTPPAVTQSFQIVVANVNDAPKFTSIAPTTASKGVLYNYAIVATDQDGDPLTITATTKPAWLTITPGLNGTATLSGTPGQPQVGSPQNVVLSVSDGTAPAVTQTFAIVVVDAAPVIGTIPPQTATEALPYTLDLTKFVTDKDTPAGDLTYTATGGLPPGLNLGAAGVLTGTPLLQVSPGDFTVAFTVRDAGPTAVPGTFVLTVLRAGRTDLGLAVSAAPNPVAVNTTATWTFAIANNSPQVGVNGVALEATFSGEVPFLLDTLANPGCTVSLSGSETRVACTLGPLAGGATTSVAITGRGNAAGDVFVSAKVSIPGGVPIDETPRNDTATSALSIAQNVSASPAQLITGMNVLGAAAGDLNKDGYTDLAVVTAANTAILLNIVDPANPAKRMLSATPLVIGTQSANGISLADIDGDGDLDVITAAGAGVPSQIFVNTNSAFTAIPVGNVSENSRAVVAGDINGDALVDLVFANGSPSFVYKNQGSVGSYSAQPGLGNADSRGVVLVDLFGDTLPELVFANGTGDAEIYRNTAGSFTLETDALKNIGPTTSVAAADLNNDGRADLVFGHGAGSGGAPPRTQVWLNTSTTAGTFFKSAEFGASPTIAVAIADIDLDGDLDILTTNDTGAHHVYANAGTGGAFALQPQQLNNVGALGAVIGKFSVDDRIDVAFFGKNGGAVFYNDGKGNLGAGDTAAPTIQLKGPASVTLTVEDTYTDAGATATDNMDGDLSAKIVVANKVNTAVIGSYVVTYSVTDTSGNSAQADRNVRVQAREGTGGGGGGAAGFELVLLLALAIMAGNWQRAASLARRTTGRA